MTAGDRLSQRLLTDLFERSPRAQIHDDSRIVIFSDLHMGVGNRSDDYLPNSVLLETVLERYYLQRGFSLLLNGDVEELQRNRLERVRERWKSTYELFARFRDQPNPQRENGVPGLVRIFGNHDMALEHLVLDGVPALESIRLEHPEGELFVFHGHQASRKYSQYNRLMELGLRAFVKPLGIRNYSVAHDSARRFAIERRAYRFALETQVAAVIGHTHRPLFESMSKMDSLRFEIERLCRKYPKAKPEKQRRIEQQLAGLTRDLEALRSSGIDFHDRRSLYNDLLVVPCLFNSGTVLGKRGMTCLEIDAGELALVHWFDASRGSKYLLYENYKTRPLAGTQIYRLQIKSDPLSYIFARIRLLSSPGDSLH